MLEVTKLLDAQSYIAEYEVVIFDLDDTLYSEKDYVKSGYSAIARYCTAIENMADKLWAAFEAGQRAIDFVLQSEGMYSEKTVQDCLDIYRNHQPTISVYPEVPGILTGLREKGIKLGLITDGRPYGQRAKIAALGIEGYFDKIIVTDELGGVEFRKPNTRAFEEMQSYFGVPFPKMVYIGDNAKKDFIAPEKLKMGSVYFKNPVGLYL